MFKCFIACLQFRLYHNILTTVNGYIAKFTVNSYFTNLLVVKY